MRHSNADIRTDCWPVYARGPRRSHEKHLPTFLRLAPAKNNSTVDNGFDDMNHFMLTNRILNGFFLSISIIFFYKPIQSIGVGVGMVLFSMLLSSYYSVVMSWAMLYLGSSFSQLLPWTHCNNTWNTEWCRQGASTFIHVLSIIV